MQRLRRAVLGFGCLILLTGIVAGCGGTSSPNSLAAPPAASPTATVTPTATHTPTPIPFPTATPKPVSPLSGVAVVGAVLCQQNDNCQNVTNQFTTLGSFGLAWTCYGRYWTGTSVSVIIALYNSQGRQIDSLNESCPGTSSTGLITENEPAGSYSVSLTEDYGPAFDVVVLGTDQFTQ